MANAPANPAISTVGSQKPGGYYANARPDLVAELPRPLGRALDVGCGEGAVGALLRAEGATWVTGIEINERAAQTAARQLNEVLVGPVEQMLPQLTGAWDTICCYDVLEHLVDPQSVLVELAGLAAPGARLHVSVPNARHVSLLVDLILRGTFGYTEWGHRDSTHLRWFTRRDIVALVQSSGWSVRKVSHPALGRSAPLDRLTRGRSTEFLVGQLYVLAERQ
jgi:2-polyprenyl-3-methyl-5-hydroxy-6-metoxy-1,4-benzoquinol methylase